ncbi:probable OVARIAN TUMOR DOMAIN-containing deubiquitinating enzyme 10 at N-terminal half [Coccomyxa sp. Obi]|nr:probable OVARIAN TUMOR DOMAIN-containing deubiquitinating enzyme 10 at N-terminal half [Coccomyxa sp. Obi]
MGGIISMCTYSRHSRAPNNVSSDPPDWADDERSVKHARDVVDKISKLCAPLTVDRSGMHTVNVFSADRLSEQKSLPPLFRRMSSITPPIEGTATTLTEMWTTHRKELEVAIHKEKGKDHADPAPDLLSQEDRLRRRLSKLNMDMNVCRGDGNCLFRAVSMELWGTEDFHESVRRKSVWYMRENKEDFEPYLGEDFAQYIVKMERSGTWGDELTLRAICDVYGIIINVVTSDQYNWFLRYMPKMLKHVKELFLTYISPVHYNTIRRKDSLRALRPSLSLTRKSIIQAAIDKADQALKEMASIPEGPAVIEQRGSANAQSPPVTPTDTLAAISAAVPPGRSSGGDASKRAAEQRIVSPFLEHQQAEQRVADGWTAVDSAEGADAGVGVSEQQQRSTISPAIGSSEAASRSQCSSHPIEYSDSVEIVLPGQVVLDGSVSANRQYDSNEEKHATAGALNSSPMSAARQSGFGDCADVQNSLNHPLVKETFVDKSSEAVKELLSLKV